jgi:hypothetical protein
MDGTVLSPSNTKWRSLSNDAAQVSGGRVPERSRQHRPYQAFVVVPFASLILFDIGMFLPPVLSTRAEVCTVTNLPRGVVAALYAALHPMSHDSESNTSNCR